MLIKAISSILALLVFVSCSGNLEKKLERTDEIYGKCDNPHRVYNAREYKICKAKERGNTSDELDISVDSLFNRDKQNTTNSISAPINSNLWNGSLVTLKNYSLKTADALGGYIETDWITEKENINKRCSIKIIVTSKELVSNGVSVFFNCQNKIGDQWENDGEEYIEESKQLTLSILQNARNFQAQ
jgi:hypothetical protein